MEKKLSEKSKRNLVICVIILLLIILSLFLIFSKKEYVVTFDTDGGNEIASVKVKENDKVKEPENPIKEGFTFTGWYYNEELYNFDTPVKQDITLKANWEENVEIEGIELNLTTLSLSPDGTATLVASLLPENAKQVKLIWTSSDENIVTVDENGNIKGIKEGTATITVKTEDEKFTASCTVTITNDIVKVEGVQISGAKEVKVGNTIKLTAQVTPDNASNKSVIWSSSNSYIAKVDQNGNVKGLKAGTVTITVETVDGSYKATYTVTVKANNDVQTQVQNNNLTTTQPNPKPENSPTPSEPTNPEGSENQGESKPQQEVIRPNKITINNVKNETNLTVGDTLKLTATITPTNANVDTGLIWNSSNTSVATIDSNGNVKAVGAGTTTITVTTQNNVSASVTINVKEKEAKYVVTVTPLKTVTGINQYEFNGVTKNGSTFTDFNYIPLGSARIKATNKTISSNLLNNGNLKSLSIVLNNGTTVTATIAYNAEKNV